MDSSNTIRLTSLTNRKIAADVTVTVDGRTATVVIATPRTNQIETLTLTLTNTPTRHPGSSLPVGPCIWAGEVNGEAFDATDRLVETIVTRFRTPAAWHTLAQVASIVIARILPPVWAEVDAAAEAA